MLGLLIDLGCKSGLIAGIALLANAAMRGRPAAERAALLQAALVALLALPLLAPLLPALDLAWLPAREIVPNEIAARSIPTIAGEMPRAAAPMLDDEGIVAILYAAGAALLSLRFLAGLWTLRRWTRTARPAIDPHWQRVMDRDAASFRRPLRLLVSPHAVTPLSWGIMPAWILIGPATHDRPEQAEAVIAHELAHLRRFDWTGLVVARLATALFWFNPLVWLVARQWMREVELAADADALGRIDRYDYAQALLAVAGGGLVHREANGMAFTRTALARRISIALDGGAGRRMRPLVPVLLLLAALGSTVPLAAARIVHVAPPPPPPPPVPLPPIPVPPLPPVPPQASLSEAAARSDPRLARSSWTGTIKNAGRAGGQLLKAVGSGIKKGFSSPDTAPTVGNTGASGTRGPDGTTRIIGRTGAQVITGPNGTTLIGGSPQDDGAAEAKRQQEGVAAAIKRGAEEQRRGRGEGMRGTATGFRARAEELERVANLPGQSRAIRESNLGIAKGFRASADDLDNKANKLNGA
jgi:beta-lactamase regulating signal transducer with metallopeptidase domain